MAMINLFNLLPINPLDGGRILKSVIFSVSTKWGLRFLELGLVASLALAWFAGATLVFLLLLIGGVEFLSERTNYLRALDPFDPRYGKGNFVLLPSMEKKELGIASLSYALTAIALWGLMTLMNHVPEVEMARSVFMC
jgi:Zn-dependent protease